MVRDGHSDDAGSVGVVAAASMQKNTSRCGCMSGHGQVSCARVAGSREGTGQDTRDPSAVCSSGSLAGTAARGDQGVLPR